MVLQVRPDTEVTRAKCSRPAKMRSALQRARAETGAEQRGVGNKACGEGGLACIEACAGSGPVPCLQRLRFSRCARAPIEGCEGLHTSVLQQAARCG